MVAVSSRSAHSPLELIEVRRCDTAYVLRSSIEDKKKHLEFDLTCFSFPLRTSSAGGGGLYFPFRWEFIFSAVELFQTVGVYSKG